MTVWKLRLFHKKVTCFVCRHSVSVFAPWYIFYMMFGVRAPWLVGNSNSDLGGWVFAKCQLFTHLIFPIKWCDLLICDLFGLSRSGVIWQLVPPHRNRESKASGNRLCTFLFPLFLEIKFVDGVCFLYVCNICRFDSEQTQAQEEVQREKSQREKLSREKDMLTGEVFGLRQQLEVSNLSYIIFLCCLALTDFLGCDVHVSVRAQSRLCCSKLVFLCSLRIRI